MIRFLIADNYAIVRIGLKHILLEKFPRSLIQEIGDTEGLIKKVVLGKWDVVICDLDMPGRSVLDALKQIRQVSPEVPVLIMGANLDHQYLQRTLRAGAAGFLSKELVHEELIGAVETVLASKKYITPAVAEKILDGINSEEAPSLKLLSDREFEVFELLASGKTVRAIASQLSLSPTTVSTYRSRVLEKLNMKSNTELIRYALENKLR